MDAAITFPRERRGSDCTAVLLLLCRYFVWLFTVCVCVCVQSGSNADLTLASKNLLAVLLSTA